MSPQSFKYFLLPVLLLASSAAFAHAGHAGEQGFWAGFLHPFTGADHLLAMLAVGIWSAMTARHVWTAPLAFVSLLLVGALLVSSTGLGFPLLEPMIAASLLVIGLMLAMRARLPLAAGAGIIGLFALFHGAAHGAELALAHPVAALSGMALGTALIHFAGILLGFFLNRQHVLWARTVGGVISLFGIGLLTGMA